MATRNRAADLAHVLASIPPNLAQYIHDELRAAEARLTNVRDLLDAAFMDSEANAMQWIRDDVRAMRRSANDARLA